MYAPPTHLDEGLLVATLKISWGLTASTISYVPVGFGTHHYLMAEDDGRRWFVNVDDLTRNGTTTDTALDVFVRAFGTAAALRETGLEFVLAPVAGADGIVVRLDDGYAVSVVPYVEGKSNEFGEFTSGGERRLVLAALGRIHAATDRVPAGLPRRESFDVYLREDLFEALDDLGSRWTGGPFSEPSRRLLAENASSVRERFERYDELVRGVPEDGWVVTHGEPHAANVMYAEDGSFLLIDWDTTAIAPCERDLWMVQPRCERDWEAYVSSGGTAVIDDDMVALYELMWDLQEIAIYTDALRSHHVEDANTRLAWKGLEEYALKTG